MVIDLINLLIISVYYFILFKDYLMGLINKIPYCNNFFFFINNKINNNKTRSM